MYFPTQNKNSKCFCGKLKNSGQNQEPSVPCQFKLPYHFLMSSQTLHKKHWRCSFNFPLIPLGPQGKNSKINAPG